MPRNDEGEFELVLGNRQLLSVFFVIVILMGVCFAAGYIFGRNSGSASDVAGAKKGPESTIVIDPTAEGKGGAQGSSLAPGQVEVRGGSPVAAAKPAARPTPTGSAPERVAAPPPPAAKPVAEPVKPAAAPSGPASVAGSGLVQPEPGQTYLQVAAVRRPDADTLVSELRKKEFSAGVTAGPNETLFRVVVGPLKDSAEVNRQRTRLKELGFDPMVKRF
ncbi:MAG: SPOR domain-containing protein [Bryobacterales bacterium]|nr:SPOR domain-containing protein [Bryobacterales bacterium]